MSLLFASQLACFKSKASGLLFDAVTLRNPGTPTRGAGGGIIAGTPVDTSANGRLEELGPQTGQVKETASRLQLVNPYVWVFAAAQTDLTSETKVIYGSRTFLVRAVMELGSAGLEKRAIVDEI